MIRLLIIFISLLAVALVAAWLADNAGLAVITFNDVEIYTSFSALVLLAVILMASVATLVWLGGFLRRELPVVGKNRKIKAQQKGLALLNKAMVSLAANDPVGAHRLIKRAELLLPPQPMLHLVAAEAALRSDNPEAATDRFKALEQMEDGKLLGQRGLAQQARLNGNSAEAKRLATAALEADGANRWALDLLFSMQVEDGDFEDARATLTRAGKRKLFTRDEVRRHAAALHYGEAMMADLSGNREQAAKSAALALIDRPGFAPAIMLIARLQVGDGKPKKAADVLRKSWKISPHPGMIRMYRELDPTETLTKRLERIRKFTSSQPDHSESLLAIAQAEHEAGHPVVARGILDRLLEGAASKRAWALMADVLEKLDDNPAHARAAALGMKDDEGWLCTTCGNQHETWQALCAHCSSFDTLEWMSEKDTVPAKRSMGPNQISMIQGALER